MIIPTHVYTIQVAPRQAVLPTEFTTTTPATTELPPDEVPADDGGNDDQAGTTKTRTITASKTTSKTTSTPTSTEGGGILAQAKATTNLSWWQLLCIALGGVLLLSILIWAVWRTTRQKSQAKKRVKEVELEEDKRVKEILEKRRMNAIKSHARKRSESTGSEWTSSDESYSSVSDGGTIVPRRRRTRRRRDRDRKRGRRRRYDSYSEESDWSDQTRSDHRRRHGRRRNSYDKRYKRRRSYTPTPSPSPSPPPVPREGGKKGFRDSVFSTYASMKKAAVQLKYVEAKVKLKQRLEEEDKIEKARQEKVRMKVKEANKEIERFNQAPSAGSGTSHL